MSSGAFFLLLTTSLGQQKNIELVSLLTRFCAVELKQKKSMRSFLVLAWAASLAAAHGIIDSFVIDGTTYVPVK